MESQTYEFGNSNDTSPCLLKTRIMKEGVFISSEEIHPEQSASACSFSTYATRMFSDGETCAARSAYAPVAQYVFNIDQRSGCEGN